MHLSKCVLVRGDQELILQGMVHVAPTELYGLLQEEMNNKVNEGYKVFFEGVRDYPRLQPKASDREYEIAEFFGIIFNLCPLLASAWGFGIQKENIKYPEDAINADITFKELVRQLKEKRFRCGFILRTLKKAMEEEKFKEELGEKVKRVLFEENPKKQRKGFSYFPLWLFIFRKINPIILDYRNRIAIDMIERCGTSKNLLKILVYYGEGHIAGMIKLLKEEGWKLASSSKLDTSLFLR